MAGSGISIRLVAACGFAAASVLPATAQLTALPSSKPKADATQPEGAGLLAQIVEDLGSDDVMLRMDAQRRLTEANSIRLRDIEGVLRSAKVGLEQRHRLLSSAYVRFCSEPRAALGVRSDQFDNSQRGVLLNMVMPGFPASGILRANDRLLSIDGRIIDDMQTMRPAIVAHDPGDEVTLVILRDGASLTFKVHLGKYFDLDDRGQRQPIGADLLEEAWAIRSESYVNAEGKDGPKPIDSGVPAAAWQLVQNMDMNDGGDPGIDARVRLNSRNRLNEPDAADVGLVAAGEARGGAPQVRLSGPGGLSPNIRFLPNDAMVPQGQNRNAQDDARQAADRMRREQALRQRQLLLRAQLQDNAAKLANAPAERRRQLMEENQAIQAQINQIELMLRPPQIMKP